MKVAFSRTAGDDVDRLAAFLERQDRASALRAVDRIKTAADSLCSFPERGAPLRQSEVRRLAVAFGRAAYLLDYRIDHKRKTVTILRIRHSLERR